jgi:AraC family transcriptional regulator
MPPEEVTPTDSQAPEERECHAHRDGTLAFRRQSVERVIEAVTGSLNEPLSLREMSRIAYASPFHFNRIFHQATGLPPAKFFGVLRLEAAKRLLLTTPLSVTDVCYEVGYNSLGTFTRRFTQSVGLTPCALRRLPERLTPALFESLCASYAERKASPGRVSVSGTVHAPSPVGGAVFVGLFRANAPQTYPVGGTMLMGGASDFAIEDVPDGVYYLLAVALPKCTDPLACLLPERELMLVGAGREAVVVSGGMSRSHTSVSLRRMQVTDPPLLILLPLLLGDAPGGAPLTPRPYTRGVPRW